MAQTRKSSQRGGLGPALLLMGPALVMVGLLFVYPLLVSLAFAFRNESTGAWDLANFQKAFSLYGNDIALTAGVTVLATALVGVFAGVKFAMGHADGTNTRGQQMALAAVGIGAVFSGTATALVNTLMT